jgi:hypothetical protein
MKKIILILLLVPLLFMAGCNDDDAQGNPSAQNIEGTWQLVNVSGSIAGVSNNFDEGVITWTFQEDMQMIQIVNNSTDTNKYSGPESGHYDYENVPNEITPQNCTTTIEVGSFLNMGCRDTTGNTMTFTQLEADGYVFKFKKSVQQ